MEWKNGGILNVGLAMAKKKEKKPRRRCQTLAYIRVGSKIECFQHEKKQERQNLSCIGVERAISPGQNGDEQAALGITFSHSQ